MSILRWQASLFLFASIVLPGVSLSAEDNAICQDLDSYLRKIFPSISLSSGTGTVTFEDRNASPACLLKPQNTTPRVGVERSVTESILEARRKYQQSGGDMLQGEIGKFFASRGWTQRESKVHAMSGVVYYTDPKTKRVCLVIHAKNFLPFAIACEVSTGTRPALPVTRLQPTTRSESRPDDPSLIRLPDGRVLPRPVTPQAPMTDQPLDWKTKP